jgi:uroporphyrinogen-III synthase
LTSSLAGRRVLITRERPGDLAALLTARGAIAVHVPLIEVLDPLDGGRARRAALADLDRYDWLVVTSAAGADRVASAAATAPAVRLAAVGTATAATLAAGAGRPVDLVPAAQRGAELVVTFNGRHSSAQRVLVAQGDRAEHTVVDGLRAAGHDVTALVAYRTRSRVPDEADRAAVRSADAVAFASGTAVTSWVEAFGPAVPPVVVAIGPSTAAVADRLGLKLTGIAADHSLDGLVTELEHQLARSPDGEP